MRIDISFATKLLQNYTQNHWTTINKACPSLQQNPDFPQAVDSQSVWFSLKQLKGFIQEIEGGGSQNQPGSDDKLGVRIYFGEYSADLLTGADDNPKYTGLHTLIMLPTLLGADGYNHDFDPATGSSDFSNSATVSAMNHGSMMPPPWPAVSQNMGQDFMLFSESNS